MSIAEKKLKAIDEISKLDSEKAVEEILLFLSQIGVEEKKSELDIDSFYKETAAKYGSVLQKLAE